MRTIKLNHLQITIPVFTLYIILNAAATETKFAVEYPIKTSSGKKLRK